MYTEFLDDINIGPVDNYWEKIFQHRQMILLDIMKTGRKEVAVKLNMSYMKLTHILDLLQIEVTCNETND